MSQDLTPQLIAAWQRCAEARVELGSARRERDRLIRMASDAGMDPRALATSAGVSLARVREILEQPPEAAVDRVIEIVRARKD